MTRFAKTQHNDAFLEIQVSPPVSSICLKVCSVVISILYCKYFSFEAVNKQEVIAHLEECRSCSDHGSSVGSHRCRETLQQKHNVLSAIEYDP